MAPNFNVWKQWSGLWSEAGWRGAVSEGFLKVAAGDVCGVSALGREKSLRERSWSREALGGGRVQGQVDGAQGGQGSRGWVPGRVRVGGRRQPWGTRGLCTGCGEEHTGVSATAFTSEGATEVKLRGPDSPRPRLGGDPVPGPGWPRGRWGSQGRTRVERRKWLSLPLSGPASCLISP